MLARASEQSSSRPPLSVRVAGARDAGGIAGVHVRAWQEGYRGLLPDELLDMLSVSERQRQWYERLSGASREWVRTLAALRGGRIVGFCSIAAPSRDADAGPRTAELAALYVDPDHWGEGSPTPSCTRRWSCSSAPARAGR